MSHKDSSYLRILIWDRQLRPCCNTPSLDKCQTVMFPLLTTILAASAATAHFTLDYPETRGFEDDKETQFCGGFPTASNRQPFPLKGPVRIHNGHKKATVDAFVSLSADPQSFDDFNKTSNGTAIPQLTPFFQISEGDACWNVDFGSLGLGLQNGSEVTLQIRFSGVSAFLSNCC